MKDRALAWIVTLLETRNIPLSVCGGLAANFYGSDRPLNDIDLFVPQARFAEVVSAGAGFVSKPAQHYCEKAEGWDLEYVQLIYKGTKIEVGNACNARIFDRSVSRWRPLVIDFDSTVTGEYLGSRLSVMPRADLIEYKSRLGRAVDLQDISSLRAGV
ncbi:nucleotidyltransferase family protein [Marinobacterium jannaschii]|uniref:hypothetical protein n=1 Tax=Marinobacterium jannaschii TaxID=64970 RepID=UPI0004864BA2|nr:hypothetical protein [Marinobacterium jannaschii]